jgi:tRNA (guanine-N(7)-)-methyltransferase
MRPFAHEKVPPPSQKLEFLKVKDFYRVSLEIGCGVGRFAIKLAQDHPEQAVIAIERTKDRFGRFQTRLQNHPVLPNLFAIHSEAVSVITHCIPVQSLDQIFILYPNPYPKLKQRNLRWPNRAFMGCLLEKLKIGGTLTLATNIEDYQEEALHMMQEIWHLKVFENRKMSLAEPPRTHFEKKYLERDETCWNMVFKK